jgi:hypothetical protein
MRYLAAYIAGALAILLAISPAGAGAASRVRDAPHVRAGEKQASDEELAARTKRAERRRKIRRQLARQVRRDPRVVMSKRFIRKAGHVRFDLPLTVRLNPLIDDDVNTATPPVSAPSDDTFDYTTDPSAIADPAGTLNPLASPVLTGSFKLAARFGKTIVGYDTGSIGVEVGTGAIDLQASSIPLVQPATPCPDSSPALKTGPISVSEISGWSRTGFLALAGGRTKLSLYTQWSFSSLRQGDFTTTPGSFTDGCTGQYFWTKKIGPTLPPVPLEMTGTSSVNPAITTDGKLRFLKLTIDDVVLPQDDFAATIHACSDADASETPEASPPPPGICTGVSGDDLPIAARLKVKKLTAEVLIGDLPS